MDMEQYLDIFIDEANEHLQNLNESILELEKDSTDTNLVNEIFRIAHTLKGMAGTMGFTKMQKLTHDMENVLSEIREGRFDVTSELVDVLFRCLDALEGYTNEIASTGNEGAKEHNDLIHILNEILAGKMEAAPSATAVKEPVVEEVTVTAEEDDSTYARKYEEIPMDEFIQGTVSQAKEQGFNFFGITIYISPKCVLKSARSFVLFKALEEMGEIVKTVPDVQDIEDEKFDLDISLFLLTKKTKDEVQSAIENLSEIEKVLIDEVEVAEVPVLDVKKEEDKAQNKEDKPKKEKQKTTKTVRVDIERLDVLMNLASELIIIKNSLENVDGLRQNSSFNESVEYLERITTNLHDAVMKVRMVPVEQVFNRFPRMVRDLSRKLNKEIELEMTGKETELDRTVIDEIGDPLVHLLRNAADHGLELPAEREATGKDKVGHVLLQAFQDGNNVIIQVKDDGKGINVERIKEKAINNGLVTAVEAENLKDKQILDFLFMPSFSTAKEVTDVSGRGVGLDVVKTKIQALGGNIEVDTKLTEGSTFTIRLPLTLAIIQALMVNVGLEKYAIPLNTIQTIERISLEDIKMVQNNEVIILRDKVIPIVRLEQVLDVEKQDEEEKEITVVIVKKGEKLAGFVVDELIGQQEIVIKSLGKYLNNIKLIAGATILGDGEVALILDINSLV